MRSPALFAALSAALFGAAIPVAAQDAEIEQVIGAQIEAFAADDFETAFSYASPMIRRMFGTPERFGAMVRQGYPMVYRPDEIRYLGLEDLGAAARQKVLMRDASGVFHVLEYEMIAGETGWKINGVRLLRAPALGT